MTKKRYVDPDTLVTWKKLPRSIFKRLRCGETSQTVCGIRLDGPDGKFATAFFSVYVKNGRWYAEVSHDASPYDTGPVGAWNFRDARVALRFGGRAPK